MKPLSQKENENTSTRRAKGFSTKRTAPTALGSQKTEDHTLRRSMQRRNKDDVKRTMLRPRPQQHFSPHLSPPIRKQRPRVKEISQKNEREAPISPKLPIETEIGSQRDELEEELEQLFRGKEIILKGKFLSENETLLGLTIKGKGTQKMKTDSVLGMMSFQSKEGINNSLSLDELFNSIESTAASRSEEIKEFSPEVMKEEAPEPTKLEFRDESIVISESMMSGLVESSMSPEIPSIDLFGSDEDQQQFIDPNSSYFSNKGHEYEFIDKQHAQIYPKEFQILGSNRFLNDNIIMSYLYYVANELISPAMRDRVYICDSFLYFTLSQSACTSGIDKFIKARDYSKREEKLFEKDFWFIPICKDQHWSLVIVCYPRKFFQPSENFEMLEGEAFLERPAFLVMDSLIGKNQLSYRGQFHSANAYHNEFQKIMSFIQMEYPVRKFLGKRIENPELIVSLIEPFCNFSDNVFPLESLRCTFVDVPLQPNGYDCGIYLLHYAELFMKNPSFILQKTYEEVKDVVWFDKKMVEYKRKQIAKIFKEIAEGRNPKAEYQAYFKKMEQLYCYKRRDFNL